MRMGLVGVVRRRDILGGRCAEDIAEKQFRVRQKN